MPSVGDRWFPDSPDGHMEAKNYAMESGDVMREGAGAHVHLSIMQREQKATEDSGFDKMFGGISKTAGVGMSADIDEIGGQVMAQAFHNELEKVAAYRDWASERNHAKAARIKQRAASGKRGGILGVLGDRIASSNKRVGSAWDFGNKDKYPMIGFGTKKMRKRRQWEEDRASQLEKLRKEHAKRKAQKK